MKEKPEALLSVMVPSWVAKWIEDQAKRELRSTRRQAALILSDHVRKHSKPQGAAK